MLKGYLSLERSLWDLFLGGWWSGLTLYFSSKGCARLEVMNRDEGRAAFHCETCGTMVVVGDLIEEACFSCGEMIPLGVNRCRCGDTRYR